MKCRRKEEDVFPKSLLLDWDKSRIFANPEAKGAEGLAIRLADETVVKYIRPLGTVEMGILRDAALHKRQVNQVGRIVGCEVDQVTETIQFMEQPEESGLYYRRKNDKKLFIAVEKVSASGLAYCYMASKERSRKRKEKPAYAENQECGF